MPILTRQDVKDNLLDMISQSYPDARMIPDHTSGSTGEPLKFYRTIRQESLGRSAKARALLWYGFRKWNRMASMVFRPPRLPILDAIKLILRRRTLFNIAYISEGTLGWFVRRLRDTDTRLIAGRPVALHLLAQFVERHDGDLKVDVVISIEETLQPNVRADIERVFECRVFDMYGAQEVGLMAAQCPGCGRYVVSDEIVHLEVMEHGGSDSGDVIVTSLVNLGMPLIRYAIGDLASGIRDGCDCGRAHATLSSIEGKTLGLVARRGGRFVATTFHTAFEGMPVKQYSVVQRDFDRFTFFVAPHEGFGPGHAALITERVEGVLGEVEVELVEVEAVPSFPGGKRRYVHSEVPYKPPWIESQ